MDESFDPDEFDQDSDLDDVEEECSDCVILRATFRRDGRIAMTSWAPGLAEGGPLAMHFRARERAGVAIADLRLLRNNRGEREVIVEFMAAGRARETAEAALCAWASATGHERVWLPGGPVPVGTGDGVATASVRCSTCRATWMDATPAFWEQVRRSGYFPLVCPTCAHPLPQWDVARGDSTRCRG